MTTVLSKAKSETLYKLRYESPLGTYILVSSEQGLMCVKPEEQSFPDLGRWVQESGAFEDGGVHNQATARQLDAYFAGKLKDFDVPLDMRGTDFQRRVWHQLTAIAYGETWSYGEVAAALGKPTASRAVGHANGSNPVSIIVPCHRVIGSSGKLVGYGGGLHRKSALLELEATGTQKRLL